MPGSTRFPVLAGHNRKSRGTWPRTEGVALTDTLGPFALDTVTAGDCRKLVLDLPDDSIDVVVTSPPYWGQRLSGGNGVEADPRAYLAELTEIFTALLPKLKPAGIAWINIGDAYNTPVNWRLDDSSYSTLGPARSGLQPENSAYTKPRHRRRAFTDDGAPWLRYGNLLGLPQRLMVALSDAGWLLRGEVIWRKLNPMPEGRCRRPHRQHEVIYLLARSERHAFRTAPPVGSVWEFGNERVDGPAAFLPVPRAAAAALRAGLRQGGPGRRGARPVQRVRHDRRRRDRRGLLVRRLRDRRRPGHRRQRATARGRAAADGSVRRGGRLTPAFAGFGGARKALRGLIRAVPRQLRTALALAATATAAAGILAAACPATAAAGPACAGRCGPPYPPASAGPSPRRAGSDPDALA